MQWQPLHSLCIIPTSAALQTFPTIALGSEPTAQQTSINCLTYTIPLVSYCYFLARKRRRHKRWWGMYTCKQKDLKIVDGKERGMSPLIGLSFFTSTFPTHTSLIHLHLPLIPPVVLSLTFSCHPYFFFFKFLHFGFSISKLPLLYS